MPAKSKKPPGNAVASVTQEVADALGHHAVDLGITRNQLIRQIFEQFSYPSPFKK